MNLRKVFSVFLVSSGAAYALLCQDLVSQKQKVRNFEHFGRVDTRPNTPEFGDVTETWSTIGATDLDPDENTTTYTSTWNPPSTMTYRRWVTGGFAHLIGFAHLPGGVKVTSVEVDWCDVSDTNHMTVNVYDCSFSGDCNPAPLATFTTFNLGGCGGSVLGFPAYTVDNFNHRLMVDVVFGATNGDNAIAGVSFGYVYQVSPAPASATFLDVPTGSPQFQFIEALVAAGITAGCGGGNYCPSNPVTRGQMAVFLAKALGLTWDDH